MTVTDATASQGILLAQQAALSRDERLDTMILRPLNRSVPDLDVVDSIITAKATLTIAGASSLALGIHDPEWKLENSGLLDPGQDGRLNPVDVLVDRLPFRLVKASRQDADTCTLTFEDIVAALLRIYRKHRVWSRGSATRAEAIGAMVREVIERDIPFWSPERGVKQPIKLPDLPNAAPPRSDVNQGFDKDVTFKIKGATADAQQRREAATVMTVCDQLGVNERVRQAALVAPIGESALKAVPNSSGSNYWGVYQGSKDIWKLKDTQGMARSFLQGGKGFQAGGAIALNRAHPEYSPGNIAFRVEGDRSNFPSDQVAAHFYDVWLPEARKIAAAWKGNGTVSSADATVLHARQYQFTRGLPGHKEDSWEAATRLAGEVNWRFYAMGGAAFFESDDYIISRPAEYVIGDTDGTMRERCLAEGLLEPPAYDWDHGKLAAQVTMRAVANRWGVLPGRVAVFERMGPLTGRWITETVELDLLNDAAAVVTLTKPMPQRKEPATELVTGTGTDLASLPGGVARTIAWARGKIGHYPDGGLLNRGTELDTLEAQFGFPGGGQPWCAMFATTALVHGGVDRDCRTAAVADIRRWCGEGSHGYLKGFKRTPRPGDLVCYGSHHVGLVVQVKHNSNVVTIEGNTSANKVTTVESATGRGDYVRPDYPA